MTLYSRKRGLVSRFDSVNRVYWGTDARTIRTTAVALCFSSAEYASPVWSRSSHASKIDPVLNAACRAISGCLRPTRVDDLYLLCGIAAPPPTYQTGSLIPAWETQTRKRPSASSLWTRSSQKETKIKAQLPPLCRTPWWQRPNSHTDSLVQPSPDNTTKLSFSPKESLPPLAPGFEWGMAHLVKPKSPP